MSSSPSRSNHRDASNPSTFLFATFLSDGDSSLDYEIIIVDDASPDGTQDIARELANVYGEDKIVSRPVPFSELPGHSGHFYSL